ncbi:uncharacterized protein FA14DRAFT_182854 [Meira miltonrushii]|uniref:DNA polymerase epsilon subunit D n=1 Tax=Meira miltonrushii TaxID=1280837 RepID=A0A316V153_9BASI|nr:uncharacterized protein FA14DRAFT_182854 [Meira miltonrushii]PWN31280.1 hypothetical protein FA14DRAFT_182854 [Meira miltonrushii]
MEEDPRDTSNASASVLADTTSASAAMNGNDTSSIAIPSHITEEQELRKPGDSNYSTKQQDKAASGPDGIDQYELAKAQVNKVVKSANPDNFTLRKEVSLAMIKASTVFISYLSASAYDKTNEAGNKTIGAQAVLSAFKEMGFPEHYYKQLKKEYNEKVNPETKNKATEPNTDDAEQQEGESAMDVDQTEQEGEERGAGEESIAVGDETLAAVDAAGEGENDEEVEE